MKGLGTADESNGCEAVTPCSNAIDCRVANFGMLCEDLDGTIDRLDEMGAPCILKQDENTPDNFYETKFVGPDGVVFDVSEHAWIGAATAAEKEIDLDALLAAE